MTQRSSFMSLEVIGPFEAPGEVSAALEGLFGPAEGLSRYMLLDGATIPNLPERIAATGLDACALYSGELAEVSPYLVRLKDGDPQSEKLMGQWCDPATVDVDPFALLSRRSGHLICLTSAPTGQI